MEKWRVINHGALDAYENMAIDEAISVFVRAKKVPPTLRFYQWKNSSISIGFFQKLLDININYCKENSIIIVRRPTGGRAILHGTDLTYSFSSCNTYPYFSEGLLKTYSYISEALYFALKTIGIDAKIKNRREKGRILIGSSLCFQSVSYGEITVKGRKVIGSAQKRWQEGFLQQGSIMLTIDVTLMAKVFKNITPVSIQKSMIGLKSIVFSLSEDNLKNAIMNAFEIIFGIKLIPEELTKEEIKLKETLIKEKYSTSQWLYKR